MGKDNVFTQDVVVPEIVREKMDDAFLIIQEERENTMKKEQTTGKKTSVIKRTKQQRFFGRAAAAAACAIVVVGVAFALNGQWQGVSEEKEISSSTEGSTHGNGGISSTEDTFTLAVMGAELEKDKPVQLVSDSSLITERFAGAWCVEGREGGGVSYCINVPFTCQGNNIKDITYSINNGAFQIVQPVGESILVDGKLFEGELNTGIIGGDDEENADGTPVRAFETVLYQSFTVDYQRQSDEDTWINICNECPDNGELESLIFQNTLENNNLGIQKMLKDTVITCTVNYADGTSKSADVLVNSRIMSCAEAGAEIKEDPDRKETFITFELQ